MKLFKQGQEFDFDAVLSVGALFTFILIDEDVAVFFEDDGYYHYKMQFDKDEFLRGVEFDAKKFGCSKAWKEDYELNYKIALFAYNLYKPLDKSK